MTKIPPPTPTWTIRLLETAEEMVAVEALQSLVWFCADLEVVPKDLLLAVTHNGGLAMGAFAGDLMIGAVFGFSGFSSIERHCPFASNSATP